MASGTVKSLKFKMGAAWDGTNNGGTEWVNMFDDFSSGTWNNGIEGQGCRALPQSGSIHYWTIGTNNLSNTTKGTVYIEVGLESGDRIQSMTMAYT
jgi:hypothetical protein